MAPKFHRLLKLVKAINVFFVSCLHFYSNFLVSGFSSVFGLLLEAYRVGIKFKQQ